MEVEYLWELSEIDISQIAMVSVFFRPPLVYREFLKRNDVALFIRVVGGGHTSTGVLFYRTPAKAEKHQTAACYFTEHPPRRKNCCRATVTHVRRSFTNE
jgi:hypothetical protein